MQIIQRSANLKGCLLPNDNQRKTRWGLYNWIGPLALLEVMLGKTAVMFVWLEVNFTLTQKRMRYPSWPTLPHFQAPLQRRLFHVKSWIYTGYWETLPLGRYTFMGSGRGGRLCLFWPIYEWLQRIYLSPYIAHDESTLADSIAPSDRAALI